MSFVHYFTGGLTDDDQLVNHTLLLAADSVLTCTLISAPEVINHRPYGVSVDWWGLGCLIYEMTAGQPPFRTRGEHPKPMEMERRIQTEQEEYGDKFSTEVKDLCSLVSSAQQTSFFKQSSSGNEQVLFPVLQLLTKDPNQRLGCQSSGGREVKSHPFFQQINFRMLEAGLVKPPFKPDASTLMMV